MVSHHPAKFGGHRHCGIEAIMVFSLLRDQKVIKGLYDYIGRRLCR